MLTICRRPYLNSASLMLMVFPPKKEILAVSCETHLTHCCFHSSSPTWLCSFCKAGEQAEHRGMWTLNISTKWFFCNCTMPKERSRRRDHKKSLILYTNTTGFSTYTQSWLFSIFSNYESKLSGTRCLKVSVFCSPTVQVHHALHPKS